jgi:Transglutaminase elicitor
MIASTKLRRHHNRYLAPVCPGKFPVAGVVLASVMSALAPSISGCKPMISPPASSPVVTPPADPISGFYATSQTEVRAKNNFYFAIFNTDYERNFNKLPKVGLVAPEKIPYVGSWYPQKQGGTNVKPLGVSALEKYDGIFNTGAAPKAAEWESKNHTVASGDESSGWAGHCNGYSAASTRHAEPTKAVVRGTTTFQPKDIKALLAEIHMASKFYFLGGNRCGLVESAALIPPGLRQDPLTMGVCDDVNPGTFHIAVANWIGIQKYPLIIDIHGKEQVWNYPHWKYTVDSRTVLADAATRLVTGDQNATNYPFNPDAKSFLSVLITLTHSEAYQDEKITKDVPEAERYNSLSYNYVLELNASGDIIGGEWIGESQRDHPDFVWVALEPMPGDGSPFSSNPNLDVKEVLKLWAESVGADPLKPPPVLMEPSMVKDWGRYPKFDVYINGAQTGVAFALEENVEISLKSKSTLDGASVEALMDGTKLTLVNLKASVPKLSSGIHVLEMKWTVAGKLVDEQRARIHIIH